MDGVDALGRPVVVLNAGGPPRDCSLQPTACAQLLFTEASSLLLHRLRVSAWRTLHPASASPHRSLPWRQPGPPACPICELMADAVPANMKSSALVFVKVSPGSA